MIATGGEMQAHKAPATSEGSMASLASSWVTASPACARIGVCPVGFISDLPWRPSPTPGRLRARSYTREGKLAVPWRTPTPATSITVVDRSSLYRGQMVALASDPSGAGPGRSSSSPGVCRAHRPAARHGARARRLRRVRAVARSGHRDGLRC
jgi:hypothetical protein